MAKDISLSDKALLAGGISLFLYFILYPFMFGAFNATDTLDLRKWFLIVGIILVGIGIFVKVIKWKLSR